ncbi:MAG TPA: rod shape-determining protein MreC [Longimicrobiales bacterium]|nr:rod shape-determining protein MreC [Longimicrobiales bacterium]
MVDYFESPRRGRWRNVGAAGAFFLLGAFLYFMPQEYQATIRGAVRGTVLRPFIMAQSGLAERGVTQVDVSAMRVERDSLAAVVAAQASLAEENRRLRELMGLRNRAPRAFVPSELVRIGTQGGESSFLLDVGTEDGVRAGSPVIASGGLLGVIWEVGPSSAQAIDWTHQDFRASAMTADGNAYGMVEARRGAYREDDQLALVGAPFHIDVAPGTRILTSGRGGVYPRGILVGTVLGIEEADTGWRKSYLLRPAVRPEAVTHVLVGIPTDDGLSDLSPLWSGGATPDTVPREETP